MRLCRNQMLYALSEALDCVEHELVGVTTYHSKRVAYLCVKIGKQAGLKNELLLELAGCAVLHDNALTEYIQSEYIMGHDVLHEKDLINLRPHCLMGERNLSSLHNYHQMEGFILYHHENADGSGVFKKKEEETPIQAQIIHFADQLDLRWDLGQVTKEKYNEIREWVNKSTGTLFSKRCLGWFLEAFPYEEMTRLQGETIGQYLMEIIPNITEEIKIARVKGIARMFASIIDYKSSYTRKHSMEIAEKSLAMSEYYGFDEETTCKLYFAAAFHDIGKLMVDRDILDKPDKLTGEEFHKIKGHAYATYEILSKIEGLEEVSLWACLHHEKLDGSGYPFGKNASELGKQERILACLDIYQALTEERSYKIPFSHENAIIILRDLAGKNQIDYKIVEDINLCFCS